MSNELNENEIDIEYPDSADEIITFDGSYCEFDTAAGWRDKWPAPTRQELINRKSFGDDAERLANNKWLDKFIGW